jgi:hypothetical protein
MINLFIFTDKYLLTDIYKYLDQNLHFSDDSMRREWCFILRKYHLPLGESYRASILYIKRITKTEERKEIKKLVEKYSDVSAEIFKDVYFK